MSMVSVIIYYRLIDQTFGVEDSDSRLLYGREVTAGHEQRSTTTDKTFQGINSVDRRVFSVLKRIQKSMVWAVNSKH